MRAYQAIRTRYYGATAIKRACVRAKCEGGAVTSPYDHSLSGEGNHAKAKDMLVKKLGWNDSKMVAGVFENDYYWVDAY